MGERKGSGERGMEVGSHAFEFCQLESSELNGYWLPRVFGSLLG